MNQIQAMRIFLRVADRESFRGAAREFHVSNALVTRAIALLEGHLKTRLLNRSTRTVSLTEAGARYLEGCRTLLEDLDHLETTVTHLEAEPRGTLRMVASSQISSATLTELIGEFRKLHPRMTVRLTLTERRVDLIEDGYDLGIAAGFAEDKALAERPLGTDLHTPVATPAFIAERGLPSRPADLQSLPFIGMQDQALNAELRFRHRNGAIEQVMLEPVYSVNDGSMVLAATLKNMGFSILPKAMVHADLKEGALVHLLPAYVVDADLRMSIVYPARQHLPYKTRAFIDFAAENLSMEFAGPGRPEDTGKPAINVWPQTVHTLEV